MLLYCYCYCLMMLLLLLLLLYSMWVSIMVMILRDTVAVVVDGAVVAVGGVGTTVAHHDADDNCYECPVHSDSDKYFFD